MNGRGRGRYEGDDFAVARRKGPCRTCHEIDYKDVAFLQRFCTPQGKLCSRKRTGNCAHCQNAVKRAVKQARFMALLPYVG